MATLYSLSKRFLILLAGGRGTRFSNQYPKQFHLLNSIPIINRALTPFYEYDPNIHCIIVITTTYTKTLKTLMQTYSPQISYSIAPSGSHRTLSAWNGIQYIAQNFSPTPQTLIAIHDAARPLLNKNTVAQAFLTAHEKGSAVCALPVKYALRKKEKNHTRTVERSLFYEVQTPQIFQWKILYTAYQKKHNLSFHDDASLVEAAGFPIHLTKGCETNIKITVPQDLKIAECLLNRS